MKHFLKFFFSCVVILFLCMDGHAKETIEDFDSRNDELWKYNNIVVQERALNFLLEDSKSETLWLAIQSQDEPITSWKIKGNFNEKYAATDEDLYMRVSGYIYNSSGPSTHHGIWVAFVFKFDSLGNISIERRIYEYRNSSWYVLINSSYDLLGDSFTLDLDVLDNDISLGVNGDYVSVTFEEASEIFQGDQFYMTTGLTPLSTSTEPKLYVEISEVYVNDNSIPYDSFASGRIDSDKWSTNQWMELVDSSLSINASGDDIGDNHLLLKDDQLSEFSIIEAVAHIDDFVGTSGFVGIKLIFPDYTAWVGVLADADVYYYSARIWDVYGDLVVDYSDIPIDEDKGKFSVDTTSGEIRFILGDVEFNTSILQTPDEIHEIQLMVQCFGTDCLIKGVFDFVANYVTGEEPPDDDGDKGSGGSDSGCFINTI